jgi:hypothetical protein
MGTKTESRELTVERAAPDKKTDFENANIEPTNKIDKKIPTGIRSIEVVASVSEKNKIMLIIEAEK